MDNSDLASEPGEGHETHPALARPDTLTQIFLNISSPHHLASLAQVCKSWHGALNADDFVWESAYRLNYGVPEVKERLQSYQKQCMRLWNLRTLPSRKSKRPVLGGCLGVVYDDMTESLVVARSSGEQAEMLSIRLSVPPARETAAEHQPQLACEPLGFFRPLQQRVPPLPLAAAQGVLLVQDMSDKSIQVWSLKEREVVGKVQCACHAYALAVNACSSAYGQDGVQRGCLLIAAGYFADARLCIWSLELTPCASAECQAGAASAGSSTQGVSERFSLLPPKLLATVELKSADGPTGIKRFGAELVLDAAHGVGALIQEDRPMGVTVFSIAAGSEGRILARLPVPNPACLSLHRGRIVVLSSPMRSSLPPPVSAAEGAPRFLGRPYFLVATVWQIGQRDDCVRLVSRLLDSHSEAHLQSYRPHLHVTEDLIAFSVMSTSGGVSIHDPMLQVPSPSPSHRALSAVPLAPLPAEPSPPPGNAGLVATTPSAPSAQGSWSNADGGHSGRAGDGGSDGAGGAAVVAAAELAGVVGHHGGSGELPLVVLDERDPDCHGLEAFRLSAGEGLKRIDAQAAAPKPGARSHMMEISDKDRCSFPIIKDLGVCVADLLTTPTQLVVLTERGDVQLHPLLL